MEAATPMPCAGHVVHGPGMRLLLLLLREGVRCARTTSSSQLMCAKVSECTTKPKVVVIYYYYPNNHTKKWLSQLYSKVISMPDNNIEPGRYFNHATTKI
jgi:hypothetical protein